MCVCACVWGAGGRGGGDGRGAFVLEPIDRSVSFGLELMDCIISESSGCLQQRPEQETGCQYTRGLLERVCLIFLSCFPGSVTSWQAIATSVFVSGPSSPTGLHTIWYLSRYVCVWVWGGLGDGWEVVVVGGLYE